MPVPATNESPDTNTTVFPTKSSLRYSRSRYPNSLIGCQYFASHF